MKKSNLFARAFAMLLAVVMVVSAFGPVTTFAATTWELSEPTEIFWVKTADSDSNYEEMTAQVQLFASMLAEKVTGTALPITYGDADLAGANDILLVLDSDLDISAQGYQIDATETTVKISASDADGLFYGCNDLIKQLLIDGSVADKAEVPAVAERAVSLDNGRKYYSVEWIKEFIREMAWSNMNALALHFSEEMGLGIESKLYPWLNGRDGELCTQAEIADDERFLTYEDVIEIVEYAKLYHVEIIPSLDSPGHMNYIVKKFNEQCADQDYSFTYRGVTYTAEAGSEIGNYFHYDGKTSIVKGSRNANYSRGIDISNEVAVAFTRSLIEEYATLFGSLGSTKFDIGGDELLGWGSAVVSTSTASRWKQLDHWKEYAQNRAKAEGLSNWEDAVAYDAFLYYMNDLNDLVRELGYTSVRMWNDDALRTSDTGWTGVVELDTDIDIWFWTTDSNKIFYDYANEGYQLYNIISDYNYYAMTPDYFAQDSNGVRDSFAQAYPDQIYNEWTPFIFYPADLDAGWKYNPGVTNPNVLGGAFGIWSDNPELKTEEEVMEDLVPLIRANAAKSWDVDANDTVDYATFVANQTKTGSAPTGTVEAGDVYIPADLTALEAAVAAYASVDGSLYTTDSYAAYTAAVEAGKALLAADKPEQADVDAAVAAINQAKTALVTKPNVDLTELNAEIAAFDDYYAPDYTEETFVPYANAVNAAVQMLQGVYTAEDVEAALAAILEAKAGLELVPTDDSITVIISGSFKTTYARVGKVATLSISTVKNIEILGFEVYDDKGNQVEFLRTSFSTQKSDRNITTMYFQVNEEDRGQRVYTAYPILTDGTRAADSAQFEFEVR